MIVYLCVFYVFPVMVGFIYVFLYYESGASRGPVGESCVYVFLNWFSCLIMSMVFSYLNKQCFLQMPFLKGEGNAPPAVPQQSR